MSSPVGHRFPDGVLRIEPHEDWFVRDAVGSQRRTRESLHGSWTLLGSLRGMGTDIAGIVEAFGSTFEQGVMFGESTIEQVRPLVAATDYRVTAEVVDVTRHHGSTIADFDLVAFEVLVQDDDGVAVRSRSSFIVPRPG